MNDRTDRTDSLAPTIAEVLTKTVLLFFFLSAMGFWVMLLGFSLLGTHPIGRIEIRWTTVAAHEEAPAGAFTSRRGPGTDAPRGEAGHALSDSLAR